MSKDKHIYIMCGIPGSGKSTFIKNTLKDFTGKTKVVSRDEIRFSLVAENEEYFSKEKLVFSTFINNIIEAAKEYDNIIIDATHINKCSRAKFINKIKFLKNEWSFCVICFLPNLEIALGRNELRAGTRGYVPPSAIEDMYNNFELPTTEEGFDFIYMLTTDKIYDII